MTVQECYEKFDEFIKQGKGDYEVITEEGYVGFDVNYIEIWDNEKKINL